MLGAGVFVFPGIAAGRAGPAAMLSFAIGGGIALLVALVTAELATAMPESGGGYYFVSRSFGPLAGSVVGIGQWLGLIFASAFYLVGFAEYAESLLAEWGLSLAEPTVLIAVATALLLTSINLLGTRGAGKLQNGIVLILTLILLCLFGYGALRVVGLIGVSRWPLPFAPAGVQPVARTAALVFTAYLGFVQIATVGGEIREPRRNLPRALVGSVLLVTLLYVLAVFVCSSLLPMERLASLGETATVEVARLLAGNLGALVAMAAGLLATLSSANASILSSSRTVFALSDDRLMPGVIRRVNERFGTPHIALLLVGVSVAGFVLVRRLELLAEVASLLHLVVYAMICASLLALRWRRPQWYVPTFRAPGARALAVAGGLSSLALIGLMQPTALLIGASVLLLALGWYGVYARGATLSPPRPSHIEPALRSPRVLMPLEVPRPEATPAPNLLAFQRLELLVLGYRLTPEQTSPEQAREELGAQARADMDAVVHELRSQDVQVSGELVFTPDLSATVRRYIDEHRCHAVLTPGEVSEAKRVLVPVYRPEQIDARLCTILRELALSGGQQVTFAVVASEEGVAEERRDEAELGRMALRCLARTGLARGRIRTTRVPGPDVAAALRSVKEEGDLVVVAEADPEERGHLFETLHERLVAAVSGPVLVVLKEPAPAPGTPVDGGP